MKTKEMNERPTIEEHYLAVRIWCAVLAYLPREGVRLHIGCENDPPEECTMFEIIRDAMCR